MKIIPVILLLFLANSLYSNVPDSLDQKKRTAFKLKDTSSTCTIISNSRSVYKDINLFGLKDSAVRFLKDDATGKLKISDIRTIKYKVAGFWKGALIGYGIGFLLGFTLGISSYNDGKFNFGTGFAIGFVTAIPTALLGGGLGTLFAEDKLYDLGNMDFEAKRKKIYYLMKEHPDR